MDFRVDGFTPEEFENAYGPVGKGILEIYLDKGEKMYKNWIATCDYGKVKLVKLTSKITKKNTIYFCVIIEGLDKRQKISICYCTPKKNFDETIQGFLENTRMQINNICKVTLNPWVEVDKKDYPPIPKRLSEKYGEDAFYA